MEDDGQNDRDGFLDLATELNRNLHPHVLRTYSHYGLTLHTVDLHYLRTIADEVLGSENWSWEPTQFETVTVSMSPEGKATVGIMCQGRLILSEGSFHDEIGYGFVDSCEGGLQMAFKRCCRYAEDDCLRRCLRLLGNSLGGCLYEQEYLQFAENVGRNL